MGVLGTVDDAEVFAAADFERGLDEAATAVADDEVERFDDHAFTSARGEVGPPSRGVCLRVWIGDIDDMPGLLEALKQDGEPYPTFAEVGDMVSGVEREVAPDHFISDCPPHLAARYSALNAWLDAEMGCQP